MTVWRSHTGLVAGQVGRWLWGLQALSPSDPLANLSFGHTGSNITTSKLIVDSKTRLTCTLDSSDTAILGHRWTKGDKVLQEDSEPDLTTQYECVRPMEAPKPRVPLGLAGEGWASFQGAGFTLGPLLPCLL